MAVLSTSHLNFMLASDGDRAAALNGYRRLLNSLDHPIQVLVQVSPADIEGYLEQLQDGAWDGAVQVNGLEELFADHAAFVRQLNRERGLLQRNLYIIVPSGTSIEGATSSGVRGLFRTLWGARPHSVDDEAVLRTLYARCDRLGTLLSSLGLDVEMLDSPKLATLWRDSIGGLRPHRALRVVDPTDASPVVVAPDSGSVPSDIRTGPIPVNGDAPSLRAGERTINDLIAPGSLEQRRDRIVVDGRASRIHALSDYPRTVMPNWLSPLLDGADPIDVSFHIRPTDPAESARTLENRLVQIQSSRMVRMRGGRLASSEDELAYTDVARLRESIERGDERVFQVSVYLRVYGASQDELDRAAGRVASALGTMLAVARPALWQQLAGLLSILPSAQDHLDLPRNIDTSSLVYMFPFGSSQAGEGHGVLYGTLLGGSQSMIIIDPFGRENANKIVFARSGSGKSFHCKVEALRALMAGISYFVIDPEREYAAMATRLGGRTIRISGSSEQHINPFDLPAGDLSEEEGDPFANHVIDVLGFLDLMLARPGETLSPLERSVLDEAVIEAYARRGITADPSTHDRDVPLLGDVEAILTEGGDEHTLAQRVRRYTTGSLSNLFSQRTSIDLDHPFVVFDIKDLQAELRPLATYLISHHVWREVRLRRRPRLLLIDEAWMLMQQEHGARFIASMVRQARKNWLGVITITQDVHDFLGSQYGQTVLSNSSLKLLMRQDVSAVDEVAEHFRLSDGERQFLAQIGPGEALLIAGNEHAPIFIDSSRLEYNLATTNPSDLAAAEAATLAEQT